MEAEETVVEPQERGEFPLISTKLQAPVSRPCVHRPRLRAAIEEGLAGKVTLRPFGSLIAFLALATILGVLAAVWPARKAANTVRQAVDEVSDRLTTALSD